mmetsp:Transcript_42410/g.66410  ORF Transcript_42410/g.66410 Transcript_42410/m.66410 type:complete len:108 (-) Transcript_42410:172-495(-)
MQPFAAAARRPVAGALEAMMSELRGKFSPRQGHTKGRTPLTSKRGPKNYYKGKGANSTGRITSKGVFITQPYKLYEFVAPDLSDCELKPYVSHKTPKLEKSVVEEAA